jgi:hypothetical protein
MIPKITGQLTALHNDTLTRKIDAFQYEVLIPKSNRANARAWIFANEVDNACCR